MTKKQKKGQLGGFINEFSDVIDELQKERPSQEERHSMTIKKMMDDQNMPLEQQLSLIQETLDHMEEIPEDKQLPMENLVMVIKDEIKDKFKPPKPTLSGPEDAQTSEHAFDVSK
ncbi:hypothetical protein DID77_04765 [Candidatus Marinamargulisbacteria bacterium SCGC AG-439-L15]|nr:hypothetical protein DID77_04765 [Candidatus Marinamargulisbacteria bacterium SCGC AG-439-L15]